MSNAAILKPVSPVASTSLARIEPIGPTNMSELMTFAKHAADSGLFAMSPQQALMIAMSGRDLGLSYTQALRAFHIIKTKPTLSADGMVAVCLHHHDVCETFRPVDVTDTKATWETKRAGADPVRYTFTIEDAQRAGLINEMYKKHPKRMLSARCKAYLARDVYPELLMGLYDPDEVAEIAVRATPPGAPIAFETSLPVEPTESVVDVLLQDIVAVRSHDELTAIAARIRPLKDDIRVTDAQRKLIGARYRDAQKAFAAPKAESPKPAPAPPAASGGVPDAEYDAPDYGPREPGDEG